MPGKITSASHPNGTPERPPNFFLLTSNFFLHISAMSADAKPYNQLYIQAWTILSAFVTVLLFGMYAFGSHLLHAGHWIWDLLRYLASPII